jgi:hypothetical protein
MKVPLTIFFDSILWKKPPFYAGLSKGGNAQSAIPTFAFCWGFSKGGKIRFHSLEEVPILWGFVQRMENCKLLRARARYRAVARIGEFHGCCAR